MFTDGCVFGANVIAILTCFPLKTSFTFTWLAIGRNKRFGILRARLGYAQHARLRYRGILTINLEQLQPGCNAYRLHKYLDFAM